MHLTDVTPTCIVLKYGRLFGTTTYGNNISQVHTHFNKLANAYNSYNHHVRGS